MRGIRQGLAAVAALVALGALAAPSPAVLRGENGLILFTSGRDGGDAEADLYHADVSGITQISPALTSLTGQHRHGTWSPDRTKIAYARGIPGNFQTEAFDIYVHDLTTGQITPLTDPADTLTADHPAWSPDGTRIAYEEEVGNNVGQRDIYIEPAEGGVPVNLTETGATPEHKPAWDPFSSQVYFNVGDPNAANALDVGRRAADDSDAATSLVLSDGTVSEFQVSLSPNGQHMCWTEGSGFNGSAEIMVGPTNSPQANKLNLTDNPGDGDYNCTWSPEGDDIAYVEGIFGNGKLMRAEWPDNEIPIPIADVAGVFDGNPDWAPDGRPTCPDLSVSVVSGQSVTIPVECVDTGPPYEQSEVREFQGNNEPANGTVTQETAGEPLVYTPDPGFIGADAFGYSAFDRGGFTDDPGLIAVNVTAPPSDPGDDDGGGGGAGGGGAGGGGGGGTNPPTTCLGRAPTITGTSGADVIGGTRGRDVILALGGDDTISGRRGRDIVCGGDGDDVIAGRKGRDRLFGEDGDDRLTGGRGRDRLLGGAGIDLLRGGRGRDRLIGGPGVDTLRGGPGRDVQTQ